MDATLDEIADSLLNQRLPDNWRKLAPETCMQLAAWLNHLQVNRAIEVQFSHRVTDMHNEHVGTIQRTTCIKYMSVAYSHTHTHTHVYRVSFCSSTSRM